MKGGEEVTLGSAENSQERLAGAGRREREHEHGRQRGRRVN